MITDLLFSIDTTENASKGKPIPNPKNKKFRIFEIKLELSTVFVKRAAMNSGLHGTTIAPKKNP